MRYNIPMYRYWKYKSAAGCLIGRYEYKSWFEGCDWFTMVFRGYAPSAHYLLINDLENVHDKYPIKQWPFSLRYVANMHKLKT